MTTLSLCIFDDLSPIHGPFHIMIPKKYNISSIEKGLHKIIRPFRNKIIIDRSGYFSRDFFNNGPELISNMSHKLFNDDYYVVNRYNKYYAIAFSINYTRFEIFSKDCDKQLIHWRSDDSNDPIKGIINENNYNENPVLNIISTLINN